jgi:hypothetical protein
MKKPKTKTVYTGRHKKTVSVEEPEKDASKSDGSKREKPIDHARKA